MCYFVWFFSLIRLVVFSVLSWRITRELAFYKLRTSNFELRTSILVTQIIKIRILVDRGVTGKSWKWCFLWQKLLECRWWWLVIVCVTFPYLVSIFVRILPASESFLQGFVTLSLLLVMRLFVSTFIYSKIGYICMSYFLDSHQLFIVHVIMFLHVLETCRTMY